MATPETVLITLKDLCIPSVYPNGQSSPSITGRAVKFRIGEPPPIDLDSDLRDGISRVNFYPTDSERDVSCFSFHDWDVMSITPATIALTVLNNTITITGVGSLEQVAVVIINNDKINPFVYATQEGDSPEIIAAALAALIPTAVSVGAVITIANAYNIEVGVSTDAIAVRELNRQERLMRICVRTQTPDDRNVIANAIEQYIKTLTSFDLVNDYSVQIKYHGSPFNDRLQKTSLFERQLGFQCQYATTETQTIYTIVDPYTIVTRYPNVLP